MVIMLSRNIDASYDTRVKQKNTTVYITIMHTQARIFD